MELHFYTTFSNIQSLKKGETFNVWNKIEADKTDVHISLNENEYSFRSLGETVYQVSKLKGE